VDGIAMNLIKMTKMVASYTVP